MQDLKEKIIVITGANIGIGKATAEALAVRGAKLRLLCRSEEKTRPVIDELKKLARHDDIRFIKLALDDFASVRSAAAELLAMDEPIHVLINNAGLAGQKGLTKNGFELLFGVNHLGHFLLTELLLERIKASAPARIVNVASRAHYNATSIDWDALKKPTAHTTAMHEYAVSKLANVLFTKALAKKLSGTGVTTYALHPGVIASNIWQKLPWPIRPIALAFMKSTVDGAYATVHTATAPELAHETGKYYDEDGSEKKPSALALDPALAAELWRRSESWTRSA
ncbi:MAG: SDR family oxidoreductase [Sandaracinaceae bacterium]|nr:SDR family oxidoreductase [Sandaracinaceae bacterium]